MGDDSYAGSCVCCLIVLTIFALYNEPTRGYAVGGILAIVVFVVIYSVWKSEKKFSPPKPVYVPSPYPPTAPASYPQQAGYRCLNCGFVNTQNQTYCGRCGFVMNRPKPVSYPQQATSRCAACGFENPPGQSFCGRCGSSVSNTGSPSDISVSNTIQCPNCGSTIPSGNKFCGKCGGSLKKADDTQIY